MHRSRVNGSILDNLLTSLYHIPKICQSVTAICCDYKILNTTSSFPNFQWLIITIILIIYYCFLKDRYKVHMLNFALYRHWRLHILQMQWCNTFVLFSTRHVLWGMSGVRSRMSSWCYVQHTHTHKKRDETTCTSALYLSCFEILCTRFIISWVVLCLRRRRLRQNVRVEINKK